MYTNIRESVRARSTFTLLLHEDGLLFKETQLYAGHIRGQTMQFGQVIVRRRRRQNLGQIRVENVQRRDFLPLGPLEK
jgi:hypothetical protein